MVVCITKMRSRSTCSHVDALWEIIRNLPVHDWELQSFSYLIDGRKVPLQHLMIVSSDTETSAVYAIIHQSGFSGERIPHWIQLALRIRTTSLPLHLKDSKMRFLWSWELQPLMRQIVAAIVWKQAAKEHPITHQTTIFEEENRMLC